MSDIWYHSGTFQTPGSGTTVIDTTIQGSNPQGIHIWYARTTSDNTVTTHQAFGHGLSDGTTSRAFMTNAQDGASNTRRNNLNTGWILMEDPTDDTVDVEGSTVAMNTDDVTLSYATHSADFYVHFEIWGGLDVSAEVDEMAVSSSPFAGLTMTTPDLLLVCTTGNAIENASQHAFMSFGYAHDNGASIDQWCQYTYMGDNDEDSVGSALVSGDIAGQYNVDYTNWTAQITAIGSNGFTWTGSNADEWAVMSLDFGGNGVDVGTFTKATGAAPVVQSLPDLGFIPSGYILATCDFTSETINTNRLVHASMGSKSLNYGHSALAVGTASSNGDRASISQLQNLGKVLQGSSALQASGVEWSASGGTLTDSTPSFTLDPNTSNAVHIGYAAWEFQAGITSDQEAFQFINDDGSESTATDLAAEDTNISRDREVTTRIRIQMDYTDNPPTETQTLQYRQVGDANSEWRAVPLT